MIKTKNLRGVLLAALLGGSAMAAHAQLDYSAYGVLDFSYGRFEPSGQFRTHRYNSNSMTASFVGVNAKYGLEGGWTPGITLESFIRFQDFKGGRNDDDPNLSRNAFVSLGSRYGLLRIGRLQTFLFDATTRFNALGNSVAFSPAVRHVFASGSLEGVQGDFYWDRGISYQTPNLEGVTVNLMYAEGESDKKGDLTGGSIVASRGLLSVSLAAQRVEIDDFIDPTRETAVQLGATYNFGWARLFGQYTQTNDGGLDVDSKIVSGGLIAPVGPGNLHLQFAHTTAKGPAVDRRHTTVSAAYLYQYDSVTDVYAVGMDDRVRGQTRGASVAAGVRWRF
ncbi:MAG: porin [Piscinibacter sp.]|nr:porin [Piscinibacter sp.]